jgi:hypothetical protein
MPDIDQPDAGVGDEEVKVPIPTTTISLLVLSQGARDLLIEGCEVEEAKAEAEGAEPDAYYQKVRDRLAEENPATPKITIPDVLLTDEVKAEIEAEIARQVAEAAEKDTEVHPHVMQTAERLGLSEKD